MTLRFHLFLVTLLVAPFTPFCGVTWYTVVMYEMCTVFKCLSEDAMHTLVVVESFSFKQ